MAGRTERDLHRQSVPPPCEPQPEARIHWCVGGHAECWNLRFKGQRDWCWLYRDSMRGLECGMAAIGSVPRRKPGHHRSEAPLLRGVQSLSPHVGPLACMAPREVPDSTGSRALVIVFADSHMGRLSCPSCYLGQFPLGAGSHIDCHLSGPWEQMLVGCPCAKVGMKPQLSPRGHAT